MDQASRDVITWTLGTFITVCTIVALATRFILLPYMRDHLVDPVKEVRKQVTENHHATFEQPTLPDRLEDLHSEVRGLARVMDVHMQWSETEHEVMHRKLRALRKTIRRHHPTNGDKND
jgi:hypothetical protein